jgi:hypothetical protein
MRVAPALVPFEDRHAGLGLGFAATPANHFALERGEESLGHGVVVSIADRAHRGHHTHILAKPAEGVARILSIPVAVVNDAVGPALREHHVERVSTVKISLFNKRLVVYQQMIYRFS